MKLVTKNGYSIDTAAEKVNAITTPETQNEQVVVKPRSAPEWWDISDIKIANFMF